MIKLKELIFGNKKQDKKEPLVSIIMPAMNNESFISKSIKSFLKQNYKNKELIIVDDNSNDKTAKISQKFSKKYKTIILIKNKKHQGISKSRNTALNAAQGEYIGHLDSDDLLKKNAVKEAVKHICKKDYALVYSNYLIFGKTKEEVRKSPRFNKKKISKIGWRHFGLYRKDIALKVGGFNEKLVTCSDGDLFIKIALKYPCKKIEKTLYRYRIHKNNIGHTRNHCLECKKKKKCTYFKIWKKENKD